MNDCRACKSIENQSLLNDFFLPERKSDIRWPWCLFAIMVNILFLRL